MEIGKAVLSKLHSQEISLGPVYALDGTEDGVSFSF